MKEKVLCFKHTDRSSRSEVGCDLKLNSLAQKVLAVNIYYVKEGVLKEIFILVFLIKL